MGLIKEFREFAMRGNVIDLAVGVVIGAAFGKIISSLVANIIMPPLNLLTSKYGVNFNDLALKIKTEGRAYGRSVFAANVRLETPHNGIARQLFTPEGPFATLPMKGDRANLAWYMKTEAAKVLAALPADQINAELNARFAAFAGKMILDGPAGSYPLILQIAESMIGPRTALLGDAARRINPLAGQGLNLGFKDVGALIDIISDARRVGLDPGADTVLISYQNWRRFDANTTALFIDVVDRIFSNDSTVLKPLRGLALTLANRVPPLRRAMTRQASAEQSSLPSLMR